MKKIGLLHDKNSKKVFLLPNEVKTLVSQGITVSFAPGYGAKINVNDSDYTAAGAKMFESTADVIANSDVLLKVNAFEAKELKLMSTKIAITMANYLVNVEMIMNLLMNKVTGIEWTGLNNKSGYLIFPQLETIKGEVCIKAIKDIMPKGFGKGKKFVKFPANPKFVILNATFAGVKAAKLALEFGYEVILLDDDLKYCKDLAETDATFKKALAAKKFSYFDANFETLQEKLKNTNVFINTCIDPVNKNKLRITAEMAQSMARGALLVDASCETGYAFHFIKKYASDDLAWQKADSYMYLAMQDMTNLFAIRASEIISKSSVKYIANLCVNGLKEDDLTKLVITHDGEITNELLKTKLSLY